jgi:hypothetical protein
MKVIDILLYLSSNKVLLTILSIAIATAMVLITGNSKPLIKKLLTLGKKEFLTNLTNPIINILANKAIIAISIILSIVTLVTTGNFVPLITNITNGTIEIINDISNFRSKNDRFITEYSKEKNKIITEDKQNNNIIMFENVETNEQVYIHNNSVLENTIINIQDENAEIYDYRFRINKNSSITITEYIGKDLSVVIIPEIRNMPVVSIDDKAFMNMNIQNIIIPDCIIIIGNDVFSNNNLNNVQLPQNLESIGSKAFMNNNLAEIKIPNNIKTIASKAFDKNPIVDIKIGNNVIMDLDSLPNNFSEIYEKNQRRAGEYKYSGEEFWIYNNGSRERIIF